MKTAAAVALLLTLLSPAAHAYEDAVHRQLTHHAVHFSSMDSRLKDYGLTLGVWGTTSWLPGRCQAHGELFVETVSDWVACGAVDEDYNSWDRVLHHFFNPMTGRGILDFTPSREWALTEASNEYNLRQTRSHLVLSILAPEPDERRRHLELALYSLGHVVHLLEDLAQPQHTRLDPHVDPLDKKDSYERFAEDQATLASHKGLSCPPEYGGYAPATMKSELQSLLDYWSKPRGSLAGTGLANYSASNFVTQDRNFRGRILNDEPQLSPDPDFPLPSGVGAILKKEQLTDLLGPKGPTQPLSGEMWFIYTPVTDALLGSTTQDTRISTVSILDPDLARRGLGQRFILNQFNYCSIQKKLLPRAVGYAAGLLSHVFRGKLEVSLPDLGLYAYADPSSPGFSSLTMKLKNATPGETMKDGFLVASVKFHRNGCFKPDLSGEFTQEADGSKKPACKDYRLDREEMTNSLPQPLSQLESGQESELTFNFPTPIPMSATDVQLQVVYQGTLGTEAEGIAVGSRDLSEPTFVGADNAWDRYQLPLSPGYAFFLPQEIKDNITRKPYKLVDANGNGKYDPPADYNVDGGNFSIELRIRGAKKTTRIATMPVLPPGRYSRIALLADNQTLRVQFLVNGPNMYNQLFEYGIKPKQAQMDLSRCVPSPSGLRCDPKVAYVATPIYKQRGIAHYWSLVAVNGYPPVWLGYDDMEASLEPDADKPVPASFPPPTLVAEPQVLAHGNELTGLEGLSGPGAPGDFSVPFARVSGLEPPPGP